MLLNSSNVSTTFSFCYWHACLSLPRTTELKYHSVFVHLRKESVHVMCDFMREHVAIIILYSQALRVSQTKCKSGRTQNTLKNISLLSWLKQNRGGGYDMNVIPAWREGITGKGVVVTILDDGLETDHPDLERNYVSKFSYIFSKLLSITQPSWSLTIWILSEIQGWS